MIFEYVWIYLKTGDRGTRRAKFRNEHAFLYEIGKWNESPLNVNWAYLPNGFISYTD